MAWLSRRLATLGVETSADLAFVDSVDLLPDLEAEIAVPAWVADPLLQAFPRRWTYNGGTYGCTVSHPTRTVQLEPLDGKAQKLREPPAGALPRFWGFGVTYKQGSRRLTLR